MAARVEAAALRAGDGERGNRRERAGVGTGTCADVRAREAVCVISSMKEGGRMDGSADRKPKPKTSWAFMVDHMPHVVARIKEARAKGEGAHIDLCWRRGVVELQPGWFWAYEAGVSVGVPGLDMLSDATVQKTLEQFPGLSILMLGNKADGTH